MKQLMFVFFTFLIAPIAGAEVVKLRLNPETYRVVLTGQDAQTLLASTAGKSFQSNGPLEAVSCLKEISRCELSFKSTEAMSFETVQEHQHLADDAGLTAPDVDFPRNVSEQLLLKTISDSATAERLYALLPGPELPVNLDDSFTKEFNGKTKRLELRNGVLVSCEQVEHAPSSRKGYSCLMRVVVPSGRG